MKGRMPLPETTKLILSVNDKKDIDVELYDWLLLRGAVVLRANSTKHALNLMDRVDVDAVITDLRREEEDLYDPTAGLKLVKGVRERERRHRVPIIMYTMNVGYPLEDFARKTGVDKVTVSTAELYHWLKNIGI